MNQHNMGILGGGKKKEKKRSIVLCSSRIKLLGLRMKEHWFNCNYFNVMVFNASTFIFKKNNISKLKCTQYQAFLTSSEIK